MDQDLERLLDRARQLIELSQRLSQQNADLREELEAARQSQAELQERMNDARARVETALARLPISMDEDD